MALLWWIELVLITLCSMKGEMGFLLSVLILVLKKIANTASILVTSIGFNPRRWLYLNQVGHELLVLCNTHTKYKSIPLGWS